MKSNKRIINVVGNWQDYKRLNLHQYVHMFTKNETEEKKDSIRRSEESSFTNQQ